MRRIALYVLLAVVAVAAVAGVLYLRKQQTSSSEQETRSAIVERGALLVAVSASGSVEPRTRVNLAFEVPGEVPGLDMARFDLENFYVPDEIERANRELRQERREWLAGFAGLDPAIVNVFAK